MISFNLFNELNDVQKRTVDEIFFQTSSFKEFKSPKEKEQFWFKFLGYYQINHPELFLTILESEKVLGYICGSHDSSSDKDLYNLLSHYSLFEENFVQYPAHLHINMSVDSHGKGLGSKLINEFELLLMNKKVKGVHLITGVDARNVSFYKKNGYIFSDIKKINEHSLLFLGKSLSI